MAESRRTNAPQAVYQRIVDTAYIAFVSGGYHATSLHDLKRLAGVTSGALAHHFPTKKDIGLSVLRERVAPAVAKTWIEPVESAQTAREGVLAAFDAIISELDHKNAVTGCPLNNLSHELAGGDPEFRDAIEVIFRRWRDAIAKKIRSECADSGEADPEALATLIIAAYSGAMSMAKASQSTAPLKICADQIAALMDNPR